jgi:hypothetical protein
MSSSARSQIPESADDRSSHDQDKPARTKAPEPLGHHGWFGWSDPLSRTVFIDGTDRAAAHLLWATRQAQARALQKWADDDRRAAQVPGEVVISYVHEAVQVSSPLSDDFRVCAHVLPYLLYPDWDVPAHPSTWLVELVDGPLASGMQTIPWSPEDTRPPAMIELPDPAGGEWLLYRLRDGFDAVNGVAQYVWAGRPAEQMGMADESTQMGRFARVDGLMPVDMGALSQLFQAGPDVSPPDVEALSQWGQAEPIREHGGAAGPGGDAL